MTLEEKIEKDKFEMMDYYYLLYCKNGKHPVRKTYFVNKYEKYFHKASMMFSIRKGFKPRILVQSFLIEGLKYPQQLPNEHTWKKYMEYKEMLEKSDINKTPEQIAAEKVANCLTVVKRYGTVDEMLKSASVVNDIYNGRANFDYLALSLSKSFNNFCKENKENFIVEYPRLNLMRANLVSLADPYRTKILFKIKEILKDDFLI